MYKKQNPVYTTLTPLLLITFFLSACTVSPTTDSAENELIIDAFSNILNYTGIPDSTTDRSVYAFSDLGAWHGYALPTKDDKDFLGSFIGPYIMTQDNGVWLSQCLSKMKVINKDNNQIIDLQGATIIENNAYPNRLEQIIQTIATDSSNGFTATFDNHNPIEWTWKASPALRIQTQLIFVSNRTALIKVAIQNISKDSTLNLAVKWTGGSFLEAVRFSNKTEGVKIDFGKNKHIGWISTDSKYDFTLEAEKKTYTIESPSKTLKPKEKWETHLAQTFCFAEEELEIETTQLKEIFKNTEPVFSKNQSRWNHNVKQVTTNLNPTFNTIAHQKIAVKCLQTLTGNWKSAAGFLQHDGLFPSYNYEWFNGFWSWDSWKIAVALAQFDTELAQNQILAMYDFQDDMGMIADCVYRDTLIENHNWRDTKPPLSAWAVWEVFNYSKDEGFLKKMLPKIEKYHNWWYQYRDIDQNGLCEYGSTDNSLIAAKWESGMDNAVRFDDTKMISNELKGGSMNRESVDLNAYLFTEKKYLANIAEQLGDTEKSKQYRTDADALKSMIQTTFYDKESGWFYDIDLETKEQLKVYGAEGWIPLWSKAATEEQAAKVRATMLDSTKFATYIPFPTLAADHPKFKPQNGYWRGPVWLDQAYFAIQGLKNYGYEKDAIQFSNHLFDRLEGLKNDDLPIRENYHPLTGEGLESNHFSWSAAHLLMLLTDTK